jgi:hypothetical protein
MMMIERKKKKRKRKRKGRATADAGGCWQRRRDSAGRPPPPSPWRAISAPASFFSTWEWERWEGKREVGMKKEGRESTVVFQSFFFQLFITKRVKTVEGERDREMGERWGSKRERGERGREERVTVTDFALLLLLCIFYSHLQTFDVIRGRDRERESARTRVRLNRDTQR